MGRGARVLAVVRVPVLQEELPFDAQRILAERRARFHLVRKPIKRTPVHDVRQQWHFAPRGFVALSLMGQWMGRQ